MASVFDYVLDPGVRADDLVGGPVCADHVLLPERRGSRALTKAIVLTATYVFPILRTDYAALSVRNYCHALLATAATSLSAIFGLNLMQIMVRRVDWCYTVGITQSRTKHA